MKLKTIATLALAATLAVLERAASKIEQYAPTLLSCGLGIVTYEALSIAKTVGDIRWDNIGILAASFCVTAGMQVLCSELGKEKSSPQDSNPTESKEI